MSLQDNLGFKFVALYSAVTVVSGEDGERLSPVGPIRMTRGKARQDATNATRDGRALDDLVAVVGVIWYGDPCNPEDMKKHAAYESASLAEGAEGWE